MLFAVGMAFTVGVLVFSVNIVHSFGNLGKNPALFGDTDTPVTVNLSGGRFSVKPAQFMTVLDNHKAVTSRIAYGYASALVPDRGDKSGRLIRGSAFDGDMDIAGLLNLEGRHPRADNEISIGINTAKMDRLTIGDKMELFIEGFPVTFRVTGIYQTGMNLGDGFRIRANAIQEMNTTWQARTFGIHLAEGVDPDSFRAEMKERFQESITVTTLLEESGRLEQQLASMNLALSAFCLILLVISFVSIFNDTMLSLQEQTKTMGIFKALGLTPRQIRATLAGKAVAGAALGLLLGMPVSLLGIPLALNALFSKLGLVDFPFSINIPGTLLIIPGLLIFAYICAWLPARRVSGLRVRNLIHA
jgi:putative ABC transport system permease protein